MRTLLLLALVAGCAVPVVLQSTASLVQIEHPDTRRGFNDALREAGAQCGQHGRVAAMDRQNCRGRCVTQFRCE